MEKNIKPFIIRTHRDNTTILEMPIQLKRDDEYSIPYDCFIFKYGSLNISYDPGGNFLRYFHNPNNSENEPDTIYLIKYKYHSVDKFVYLFSIKSSGIFRNNYNASIHFGNSVVTFSERYDIVEIIKENDNG